MDRDKPRFGGAAALVTGASSGIGLAIARRLASEGAAVLVDYHSHRDEAEQLIAEIKASGGTAIASQADVSKEADVVALFDKAVEAFGRIDVVIANSGTQKDAPAADMTLEDWRTVIDLDLTGQFLCCREAVRRFRRQPRDRAPFRAAGAIVSIGSVHDRIPWAGHINYAAAKGGARMLMETLAQEVAEDGVRVNMIAPGATRTPINRKIWEDPVALARLLKLVPYGRIGEPEDVAAAVAWLASDEADYVTGATLYVDGGMKLYPEFRDNG